jgi:hypothetical protein
VDLAESLERAFLADTPFGALGELENTNRPACGPGAQGYTEGGC